MNLKIATKDSQILCRYETSGTKHLSQLLPFIKPLIYMTWLCMEEKYWTSIHRNGKILNDEVAIQQYPFCDGEQQILYLGN